jgi:hypothetical protein
VKVAFPKRTSPANGSAAGFTYELLVNLRGGRTEHLTEWSTCPPGWTVDDVGELTPVEDTE